MAKLFVVNLRKQHEEEIVLYEFLKNPDKSLFITTEHVIEYLKPKLNSKNIISDKKFKELGGHEICKYNGNKISSIILYNTHNFNYLEDINRKISHIQDFTDIYIFYGAEPIQYNIFKYIEENRNTKTAEQMIADYQYSYIPHLKVVLDFELMTNLNINLIVI